ncbi:DUF3311 domain-containing protein [Streptomyces sp. NPDC058701]|uniref:DUF3311 domain-containing protein n=1 Tax=Streptomyces sp. NPDC058701 TaxID=3346608 RepID=UPI003654C81C
MRSDRAKRPHLAWLAVPFVLFVGALPLVNRVEPRIGGVPFLLVWCAGATLVTPLAVWLAWRGDHR